MRLPRIPRLGGAPGVRRGSDRRAGARRLRADNDTAALG